MNIEFEVFAKKCSNKEYNVPSRKWWCYHKHDCTEALCPLKAEEKKCKQVSSDAWYKQMECGYEVARNPRAKYCEGCGGKL